LSIWLIVTGPFGTYDGATILQRAFYWPIVTGLGVAVAIAVRQSIAQHAPDLGYWNRSILHAAILAGIMALPVFLVISEMVPDADSSDTAPGIVEAGTGIFATAMGLHLLRCSMSRRPKTQESRNWPPLLARLPQHQRGAVLRLSSSDHYVHVVTDRGAEPLLMRFADAIAELDGVDGLRVHRSHWVARAAVTGVQSDRGRMFLEICDGTKVPVSRSYRAAVEAAGLARRA